MKKWRVALSCIPVLLCAGAIFCFSAQNGEESAALSTAVLEWISRVFVSLFGDAAHTVLRKCAHFTLYCALMFFTYNACFQARNSRRLHPVLPFVLDVLYAVSDEVHQYFVPDRACRLFDVGVDALGCAVGGLCFWLVARGCMHLRKKRMQHDP